MASSDDTIRALREALEATPDNIRLRRLLAETLHAAGQHAKAEEEYRLGLRQAPEDLELKLGLATTYFDQLKDSHASVVLESLLHHPKAPAAARVLRARIQLREGSVEAAVHSYREALDQDPAVADPTLSEQLGVHPEGSEASAEVVDGRVREGAAEQADVERDVERPKLRFADVGGMDQVKEEINLKIIQPLQHPELYRAYGKSIGGGILLYGPPGCGKTLLARATAGQVEAPFLCVGLHDVLDMYIGQSQRNLHGLFEQARAQKPFVLFFDEVDALGGSRSGMEGGGMRMTINQFLEELDGAEANNDGILVLAATNAPWHLDPAFRRPGRFDRIIFVPPPDQAARVAILQVQLEGKPLRDIDYAKVAKRTADFSGADLKGVVDRAVEGKLKDAMRTGTPQPLETRDLIAAAKSVQPSTREWFATARNYVLYSNQGGLYDDVARYLDLKK